MSPGVQRHFAGDQGLEDKEATMKLGNVRLIDGTGRVWDRATIHLDGERIATVTDAAVPPAGDTLDLSGKTVIPGLINCHSHLCLDGSPDPLSAWQRRSITENVLLAAGHAEATLRAGITTVRDLGGFDGVDLQLRKAIHDGLVPGPRMLASGKPLCMTGGQGHVLAREVDGPHEARKGAREQLKAGADIVKLMATGGVMTPGVEPGSAQLTWEEMRAAVEEAHKAGKLTASHAQGTAGVKNALRAGIDSIEHGFFLDAEAIDMMLEQGTVFVPTLAALQQALEAGTEAGIPPFVIEKARRATDAHLDSFRRAREAGVRIAAGNDGGTPFNLSDNLAGELECLVAAGMTPAAALDAAHSTAAELLGMADQIGTVEPGKLADLVVLDADPLDHISAVRQVHMVIKDGQHVRFG
jgi:imidazolonepropionase-like amidohydrolase